MIHLYGFRPGGGLRRTEETFTVSLNLLKLFNWQLINKLSFATIVIRICQAKDATANNATIESSTQTEEGDLDFKIQTTNSQRC